MTNSIVAYASRDEIKELGFRLQKMMPSAQTFTLDEAISVAQIAVAHKLDPFNGEVWGLKGYNGQWYGVMVGIKGLRKCARRAAANENGSYWIDNQQIPDPSKYNVTAKGAVVYECVLRDSVNMQAYGQAVHSLTSSGIPYKEAVEMIGPAPCVVGVGVADPSEKSKMGLHARAKKRAEADALKQRYDVDFGDDAQFSAEEPDFVEGEAENLPDSFDQGVDEAFPGTEEEKIDVLMGTHKESKAVPHPDVKSKRETEKPDGPVGMLLDLGVDNTPHAAKLATKLKLNSSMSKKEVEKVYGQYTDLKADGKTSDEAAAIVTEGK